MDKRYKFFLKMGSQWTAFHVLIMAKENFLVNDFGFGRRSSQRYFCRIEYSKKLKSDQNCYFKSPSPDFSSVHFHMHTFSPDRRLRVLLFGLGSRRWNWKFRGKYFWNPDDELLLHSSYSFGLLLSTSVSGWDLSPKASPQPWKNCEKQKRCFLN